MKATRWLTGLAGSMVLLAAGCGGGGGIGGTGSPMGTMRVSLTDAPSCGYDEVNVTVEKVRVNRSASAGDSDSGWVDIPVTGTPMPVDLLSLSNGVLASLGEADLPAGHYAQLRLVLAANSNNPNLPLANSVVLSGTGVEKALDTPSAQQTGLKINVDLDVPATKVLDVVLDFDACKSVVKAGNSGKYLLKPVLKATPVLSDAGLRVVGWIEPAAAASAPSVSVQASGVPVKATLPDPITGQFVLYPVPVGNYDLVVTGAGRVTSVMTGVPVVDTAYTYVNSASAPIAPALAASAPQAVSGFLTSVGGGIVRALQTLTGGPTVEVAAQPVSAGASSPFGMTLPVDAPQKTSYAPNPPALTFVPDPGSAGRYTLEATADGATQAQAVDLNVLPIPPVTFVFP